MARKREPAITRQRLLHAAFREFHRAGFQGADLMRILAAAGVTKGALYHHFESKRALGYAVVSELLGDWIRDRWLRPLESADNPLATLVALAQWGERSASQRSLALGCPLLRLSQELAGDDEGFRLRLVAIYEDWQQGLVTALSRAQSQGQIRPEVDVAMAATFIVATWQGTVGLAKSTHDLETLRRCRSGLVVFLQGLENSP
jgi:TetR/AcrR family transcriptional repressor of nem operon